jgi:hypothetical protein
MRAPRTLGLVASVAVAAASAVVPFAARADSDPSTGATDVLPAHRHVPVVLTGAQLPDWSRLAAVGTPMPYPSGALTGERDAHNGITQVPPDARTGVDPDQIVAFRWDDVTQEFVEIPVQVDQRFPFFLANPNSDFGIYSGTDTELTYQWDVEAWKMTAGTCTKAYPPGESAMADPVDTLDDDDEIVFMASDAGPQAPAGALGPIGTDTKRQELVLTDPATGTVGFAYLFLRPTGSRFDATNGYVQYDTGHHPLPPRRTAPRCRAAAAARQRPGSGPPSRTVTCASWPTPWRSTTSA